MNARPRSVFSVAATVAFLSALAAGLSSQPAPSLSLTLHTRADPLVLVQNETVFRQRVLASRDRSGDLVQLYTVAPATYPAPAPYGAGHCNFTKDEHLGVVSLLDDWVRNGVYPSSARILAQFPAVPEGQVGTHGVDLRYQPGVWPAEAGE